MKIQNHRKIRRYVGATTLCLSAAVFLCSAWADFHWRKIAFARAEDDLKVIVSNLSRNVLSSVELSDAIITSVDRTIRENGGTIVQMKTISADIAAVSSVTTRIQEILFAETGGWALASSIGPAGINRNVKQEPFFRKAISNRTSGYVITRTSDAAEGVAISRRSSLTDGTATGVVAAIVPNSYFQRIWTTLDAGRGLWIGLSTEDGAELIQYGPKPGADDTDGISSRQKIDRLPLILDVRWPQTTITADWKNRLPIHIGATLIIVLLILSVSKLVLLLVDRSFKEQTRLSELAETDALTGLGNRRAFMGVLTSANQGNSVFSLLLLDLDRFKSINDVNGHLAGDAILAHVGRALRTALPDGSTIARLGGDEFAAVVPGSNRERLASLASGIMFEVGQPVGWLGKELRVGCSIGISAYPEDGATPDLLFQAADLALYQAKSTRAGYRLFQRDLRDQELGRRKLEADLKAAIERGQIVPYYQPVVCLRHGNVVGFEILARWHHPEKGILPPSEFIGLAEERRLITPLTISLLRRALADTTGWPSHIRLAINISPQQLREPLLARSIFEVLRDAGFDPSRLEIELTEDAILDDYELAKSVMAAFRLFGATIALDDFGTGYSSLAHLRELRFDKLKIDRSFIEGLPDDKGSTALVETIVYLATSFDLHVTAEGVETQAQASFLRQLGCTYGQGYLFGRPCDAAASGRLVDGEAPHGVGAMLAAG